MDRLTEPPRHRRLDAVEFARRRVQALRKAVVAEVADINRGIAHVLRGGMLVSLGVLVAGLAIAAIEQQEFLTPFPSTVLAPNQILDQLVPPRPGGLLSLGILVLILTPVVRVALSLTSFLRDRDRLYVGITAIVLLNLILGFLLGVA